MFYGVSQLSAMALIDGIKRNGVLSLLPRKRIVVSAAKRGSKRFLFEESYARVQRNGVPRHLYSSSLAVWISMILSGGIETLFLLTPHGRNGVPRKVRAKSKFSNRGSHAGPAQ